MIDSAFVIQWQLSDEEWTRAAREMSSHAPGSEYDRKAYAAYSLFNGVIELVADGRAMFAAANEGRGRHISVLDVAIGLAIPFLDGAFSSPTGSVNFQQSDDDLQIAFSIKADTVEMQSNDEGTDGLTVSRPAFLHGVLAFVCSFGRECESRIPGALEWESLRSIKRVLAEHCSKRRVNGS